ncbi:MAG: hypothetical protein JSS82_08895 [Bacteroidetes bacterium]|nr:hypothetical protein [Bacteroidota bacterium]
MRDDLHSDYFDKYTNPNRTKLDGLTYQEYNYDIERYNPNDDGRKFHPVSSPDGPDTIDIVIEFFELDKGKVLSHECGHIAYEFFNEDEYRIWVSNHMRDLKPGGHGAGNPSGIRAFLEEEIYLQNKKLK